MVFLPANTNRKQIKRHNANNVKIAIQVDSAMDKFETAVKSLAGKTQKNDFILCIRTLYSTKTDELSITLSTFAIQLSNTGNIVAFELFDTFFEFL